LPAASTRRAFLGGLAATVVPFPALAAPSPDALKGAAAEIAAIEAREGGRLGVAVIDSGSGLTLTHRADERFPMCSTFKLLAAAALLARVDAGSERLDRKVSYGVSDLLEYAPVTKAHVAEGGMTLGDLCAAAIDWSDNTAANLILQAIDGPAGFTRFVRGLDDAVTRLDRNEPTLNTAIPGDERDTTSPLAMARSIQEALLGKAITEPSRRQLADWLIGDKVGDKRLRAGLPASWRIGDKTGTGDNGTANVIGIIWPPERAPLLAASYYTGSTGSAEARNGVHRQVAEIIAKTF
jgi:beta-lactamase class A